MKKKFDYNKKYTVFDKVKMEMPNWTGYNAELLDDLVESGNELLLENEKLKKEKWCNEDVTEMAKFFAWACIGIFCLGGLITCGLRSDGTDKKQAIAYRQGQVDVLTDERVVYESTIHGYKLKKEYTNQSGNGIIFGFKSEDGSSHSFYLKN